jgi:hypothetical protein
MHRSDTVKLYHVSHLNIIMDEKGISEVQNKRKTEAAVTDQVEQGTVLSHFTFKRLHSAQA